MPAVNAGFLVENSGLGNNEMEIPKHGVILDGLRFVVFRAFCAKYSQMLPLYGSRLDSMNPYVWLITEQMRKILNELPPSLHGLQVIIHSFEKSL